VASNTKSDAMDKSFEQLMKAVGSAPPRCEVCDESLPNPETRIKHIESTGHCRCLAGCGMYVQPGGLYSHMSDDHNDIEWNDHQVSWTDKFHISEAQLWYQEEYYRNYGKIYSDMDQWVENKIAEARERDAEKKKEQGFPSG
jgi:hypothetical protein